MAHSKVLKHRLLLKGEIIKARDEFYSPANDGRGPLIYWHNVKKESPKDIGKKWRSSMFVPMRRRIRSNKLLEVELLLEQALQCHEQGNNYLYKACQDNITDALKIIRKINEN